MRAKLGLLCFSLCAACSRSHLGAGEPPDVERSTCEVLLDEILTAEAYGSERGIGVGPDGSVYAFFWDGESLIASRRAPGGGWTEQVLQGMSLDSPDFAAFRVAAGGRPAPSLLMAGSYQATLWQLQDGVWERRFSESSLGQGSELPIAVSPEGAAHFVVSSALDGAVQQLYVLPLGEPAPTLAVSLSGLDPLLALDLDGQRHVLQREAGDSVRWLYQAAGGAVEEAFAGQHARPVLAVAAGEVAALYRDDDGLTQLATRGTAGWQSEPLGPEIGEECGDWDRPVEGRTCLHRAHRYSAWALAGGPRLALVAFERDEQGQRVVDCSNRELGCVWTNAADFVERSRLVFGRVGAGVELVTIPVEVPSGSRPTWRFELDQGEDGTLHLLLPGANEWEPGPLRYVRVRCDDP